MTRKQFLMGILAPAGLLGADRSTAKQPQVFWRYPVNFILGDKKRKGAMGVKGTLLEGTPEEPEMILATSGFHQIQLKDGTWVIEERPLLEPTEVVPLASEFSVSFGGYWKHLQRTNTKEVAFLNIKRYKNSHNTYTSWLLTKKYYDQI